VLVLWEVLVTGYAGAQWSACPRRRPSQAGSHSLGMLWTDFSDPSSSRADGYASAAAQGLLLAWCARIPFLRRGLCPVGNLVAALPVIGIAPIMGHVVRLRLAVEGAVVVA
jgi:NitT/TauT family transport system permease protein